MYLNRSLSDSDLYYTSRTEQCLEFDEKQLATFLYNVYLSSFADENIGAMFRFQLPIDFTLEVFANSLRQIQFRIPFAHRQG